MTPFYVSCAYRITAKLLQHYMGQHLPNKSHSSHSYPETSNSKIHGIVRPSRQTHLTFNSVILDHESVRYILNLILLRVTTVTSEQVVRQFGVASHQVIVKIFKQKCQRKWQFYKIRCFFFILFFASILTSD